MEDRADFLPPGIPNCKAGKIDSSVCNVTAIQFWTLGTRKHRHCGAQLESQHWEGTDRQTPEAH